MANFNPPLGQNGERRNPTQQEREEGFPCGPAQRALFMGLFHRIESELKSIQDYAGITGIDGQNDQVLQAILDIIAAQIGPQTSTGGGIDTSLFVLMSQARARLPIYPEVTTPTNGIINVTSPGVGTVRIPAGAKFLHRGIGEITTTQQDFNTDPGKVYHLRWNPTDGFALKDITDGVYNPTSAAETNAGFDSGYDDMLVSRITTTNPGNSPSIQNLVNKHSLIYDGELSGPGTKEGGSPAGAGARYAATFNLNWARKPFIALTGTTIQDTVQLGSNMYEGFANRVEVLASTRYGVSGRVTSDFFNPLPSSATVSGVLRLFAKAG